MRPSKTPWSLAVAVALSLAACDGVGNEPGASLDEQEARSKVRVQASATPSTATSGEEVLIHLTVTANPTVTADVTLRVLKPDGSLDHTASWPGQNLTRTATQFDETMVVAAGNPVGTYSVGARVQRTGSTEVLFDANGLATFAVTGSCVPACSGKVCGSDGCGGSCGTCGSGQSCNASGQCVDSSGLPPLWNASPPAGVSPAPSGPVVGRAGEFDTGTLATNEVWDNFNGAAGSNPDGRLWLEDTINQGGTQVYDPARSFLDGNGNAVLEAIQSGSTYFSGRFTSRTKFNMQYGWCAARIKFPKAGRSWFPAWWMLLVGYNYNPYGEIDLMEFFGNTTQYSTHLHFGGNIPSLESNKTVPASHSGGDAGDGFHTYWMQWEPDRIRIGVDDLIMGDWGPTSVSAGVWAHMQQPFYFIANFAVAPPWLPAPSPGDFPARMVIDWIWYKPL